MSNKNLNHLHWSQSNSIDHDFANHLQNIENNTSHINLSHDLHNQSNDICDDKFTAYSLGDKVFNVNVKKEDINIIEDFNDAFPIYDPQNGLHLKLNQKNTSVAKILKLNINLTTKLLMDKWDKLSAQQFNDLSQSEYQEFMNDFIQGRTQTVKQIIAQSFSQGFETPSTVQKFSIPFIISGKDGIIQFYSGSGKTHAFLFGTLWHFDANDNALQTIYITSSHEVAKQIYERIKHMLPSARVALCIGTGGALASQRSGGFKSGAPNVEKPKSLRETLQEVKKAQIIVGTIGKIHSYFTNERCKCIDTKYLKALVVDEFDVMVANHSTSRNLKSNTESDMRDIIQSLSNKTQRIFMSATVSQQSVSIAHGYFRKYDASIGDPFIVLLDPEDVTLEGIKQYYVVVDNYNTKQQVLLDLLQQCRINQCIVFTNRVDTAIDIKKMLDNQNNPMSTAVFHSKLSPERRDEVQSAFRTGKYRLLISTDVIARGFDSQSINLVVNFDMPDDYQTYIHRIGRSGRFGRKGNAISFIIVDEKRNNNEMQKVETINQYSENNKIMVLPGELDTLL